MRPKAFDYFTTWSALAQLVAYFVLVATNYCDRPQAWVAVFTVCLALSVCVLGTDAASYHMNPPPSHRNQMMRNHMWLHTVPLVLAMALLSNWQTYVGVRVTASAAIAGVAAGGGLFAAWFACPLETGERGFSKMKDVYNTQDPFAFLSAGALLGVTAALLARSASISCLP